MCGANDVGRPLAETERMAGVIGCPYALVPGAGHISKLKNSAFVTRMLVKWLSERALAGD